MLHIAYSRVSTDRQGQSGLGLDAQRDAVKRYLNDKGYPPFKEFEEVESGTRNSRPVLAQALATARVHGATLVVAKVDRLTRNAAFLSRILESGVEVVFLDMPVLGSGPVSRYMLQNMASIAELEAGLISQRTKDALKAAKARGVKLGGNRGQVPSDEARRAALAAKRAKATQAARDTLEVVQREIGSIGHLSFNQVAKLLNEHSVPTPSKAGSWQAVQVQRLLANAHRV